MLIHPTLDKLHALRLTGMCKALEQQWQMADHEALSFEERLGLMVDREMTERDNRRLQTRLRQAKLREQAVFEDIDYHHPRGLDKGVMVKLATCQWIKDHHNLLVTGPTGAGKTWLACALAHKACREGYTAQYVRLPRLWRELSIAKADGRYPKLLAGLAKTELVVLDDFALTPLSEEQRRDLLEILEDRHGTCSTLITSQLPVNHWHEAIGEPTLADAILDRLIHSAYKITLKGESMRKRTAKLTTRANSE